MTACEVITAGRVSVDLYPEQIGVPLAEVRTFAKSLGGSATNVAVATARLGRRSAVVTKVGDDGFGLYVRQALEGFGVDTRWVGTDPVLRTPLAFCELYPPDHFPLLFIGHRRHPTLSCRLRTSTSTPSVTQECSGRPLRACRRSPAAARHLARWLRGHAASSRSTTSTTGRCSGGPAARRGCGRARPSPPRP